MLLPGIGHNGGPNLTSLGDINSLFTLTQEAADWGLPIRRSLLPPILRDYQLKMLTDALALMRQGHRRILIQAPTGAGKTVLAGALLGCVAHLGLWGEFMVHRRELIKQTSVSFDRNGLMHGFVASGFDMDLTQQTILAGVQTLVRRLGFILPPNLAIIDEAHHATSETWAKVLESYGNDCYIIGLTATPERLDGRGLEEQFDVMVLGPTVAWLISHGYLSPFEFYAPSIPDMSSVDTVGGDYNPKRTAEIMGSSKVVGDFVQHYLELGRGMQGILFLPTREVSKRVADAFRAHGIPAMHVDGDTKDKERDRFDDAFRAGDVRMATNVDLFGEGYDVPNIGYVGDGSPSKSRSKVAQRWGRPIRPVYADGYDLDDLSARLDAIRHGPKDFAVICDHAGNALPCAFGGQGHGLPDDDYDYTLKGGMKRKTGVGDDATPITTCMTCYRVYPSSSKFCPGCESDRRLMPRVVKQVEGKLTKLEREELKKAATARRKQEERSCASLDEMISLGRARGHRWPEQWAKKMCRLYRIPLFQKPEIELLPEW